MASWRSSHASINGGNLRRVGSNRVTDARLIAGQR